MKSSTTPTTHDSPAAFAAADGKATSTQQDASTKGDTMRLLNAICEVLEAYAARLRTETLEAELDAVDWALMGSDEDED